jgi:hypothetical protein
MKVYEIIEIYDEDFKRLNNKENKVEHFKLYKDINVAIMGAINELYFQCEEDDPSEIWTYREIKIKNKMFYYENEIVQYYNVYFNGEYQYKMAIIEREII